MIAVTQRTKTGSLSQNIQEICDSACTSQCQNQVVVFIKTQTPSVCQIIYQKNIVIFEIKRKCRLLCVLTTRNI